MAKKEKKQAINPKKPVKARPAKKGKVVKGVFADEPAEVQAVTKPAKNAVAQPSKIKKAAVEKAVTELTKFAESLKDSDSDKKQLFEDEDDDLYVQVTNVKFFSDKLTLKPKTITVPHSLFDMDDFKVCLFVKDDLIDADTLEQIEASNIPHLDKIIAAKELKGEYKSYDARRKLVSEYDLFLSDDSLVTVLPKLLGKVFYGNQRTTPVSIRLRAGKKFSLTTLKNQIEKASNQIVYVPPMGVNVVVKVGALSLGADKLYENITAIADHFSSQQIRSISVKIQSSPSLPVFYAQKLHSDHDVKQDEPEDQAVATRDISDFDKALLALAVDEQAAEKLIKKRKSAKISPAAKKQKV